MFKKLATIAEELKSPFVEVELEARMKIQQPINIDFDEETNITYFRSTMYPSIVFRRFNNSSLNSKELVEKIKIKDVVLALSIEQSYASSEIRFPLIESNTRKIYRKRINTNPIVEITRCENEYSIEIEFNISNYNKVDPILKEWKTPYWPSIKPMEISSINLAKKLAHSTQWAISNKADGEHVLIYKNKEATILIHDNGLVTDINLNTSQNIIPEYVYEAELMEDNSLLYYDCLMYNSVNITKQNYIKRLSYIKENKKEIIIFNNIHTLKSYLYTPHKFKTDGYIISNLKNRNLVFKSKFKNTVDLKYVNGYLLLENEEVSERIPKNIEYEYKEQKIYEFDMDMNLIKERNDKTIANFKMPYDDNPLYKIISGIGIPTLRYHHNKIKMELLRLLPKNNLLDIGSAKGGDIHKWYHLKFKKVYAVDPQLNLRQHSKNVIEINDYVQNVYNIINYDSVSILFVPWDDSFFDVINKADNLIIAWMSKPKNYSSDSFTCKINDYIELEIPESETSTYVTEKIISYKYIIDRLIKEGWNHTEILTNLDNATNDEIELSKMYSFHYMNRIK